MDYITPIQDNHQITVSPVICNLIFLSTKAEHEAKNQ